MAGVRLHHPNLRNTMLVMEDPDRAYPVPFLCTPCERAHQFKAIHLRLDAQGDVVVAEEAWDNMKHLFTDELKVLGAVSTPEPMVLGMGGGKERYNVVRMEDSHG